MSLGLASTIKAVAIRLWTSLYFPLNWSADAFSAVSASRRGLYGCADVDGAEIEVVKTAAFGGGRHSGLRDPGVVAAGRIAHAGWVAGPDLPSVWFAILLALAVDGTGVAGRVRYALAAIVLLFHFAALQHNLHFWEAASAQVKAACATGSPMLPGSVNGVPALANGRQECIEIAHNNFGQP